MWLLHESRISQAGFQLLPERGLWAWNRTVGSRIAFLPGGGGLTRPGRIWSRLRKSGSRLQESPETWLSWALTSAPPSSHRKPQTRHLSSVCPVSQTADGGLAPFYLWGSWLFPRVSHPSHHPSTPLTQAVQIVSFHFTAVDPEADFHRFGIVS